MDILLNCIIFCGGFILIWYGSGLIIHSVDKISHKLKISSFAISFFLLGILTSIPEISLGLTALAEGTPGIFVGNLIGGMIVVMFFVIPLLAVFGNGIKLSKKLEPVTMLYAFLVFLSPIVAILDKKITTTEALFMLLLYSVLFFVIQREEGILDGGKDLLNLKRYSIKDMMKVLLGVVIVFIASSLIVNKTLFFAEFLGVSPFLISMVVLSLGTNLPEITLAVRAVVNKKKDIAFGDYLGSASANVVILAALTLLGGGDVVTSNGFWKTLIVAIIGFILFYHFTKSKRDISRHEGSILLLVYALFLLVETIELIQ